MYRVKLVSDIVLRIFATLTVDYIKIIVKHRSQVWFRVHITGERKS